MIRTHAIFGLWLVFALAGCVGSIAPIADSSETDDALLGTWRGCQGTKIEVFRSRTNPPWAGYQMRLTSRYPSLSGTYRLLIQRIGDDEYVDASYIPREATVKEFTAFHGIALIRHDGNDVLLGPMGADWWIADHLKDSGLQVVNIGTGFYLILGTSSDLKTFLAAHAHDPGAFAIADERSPNYGRLKRHWTAAEAEACGEDL
jgi:hypothetical protein